MASKVGYVHDNGGMTGMTCGAVDEGGVKVSGSNGVDDVYGGNIISYIDQPPLHPPAHPLPLPLPHIGCILTIVDDIVDMMNGPYDVDAFSSCHKCDAHL